MHMRTDAMKVAAAVLTASNCRETVSLFANYTSSKGASMETVETPLDPPLIISALTFSTHPPPLFQSSHRGAWLLLAENIAIWLEFKGSVWHLNIIMLACVRIIDFLCSVECLYAREIAELPKLKTSQGANN